MVIKQEQKMPTLFVNHGSPTLALDADKGHGYRQWSRRLPRPKAILVFSAHWESEQLAFGETSAHNKLVYDFHGFPEQLYNLEYPAPGSKGLVDNIQTLFGNKVALPVTKRGLDHGVWVPFLHLWPEADVPIVQMSIPKMMSNAELYELGEKLAPLRERGVLIVGSGTITHNLKAWFLQQYDKPAEWAKAFDDWTKDILLSGKKESLLNWETQAPYAKQNHPTPEHFRPLLIIAGAANMQKVKFPIEGFDAGILSNRSVQFC